MERRKNSRGISTSSIEPLDDRAYSRYRRDYWRGKEAEENRLVEILARTERGIWL